jgi:pimeloyl-ACP methyl ester carboxylesterase
MGCSIGGLLAPDLAFHYPDEFRAVIGINGALARFRPTPWEANEDVKTWFHPRVANDAKASSMLGVMSPSSPEAYRRETAWVYSQGAPPVFRGDIFYYTEGHDLTAEQARLIDTTKVDVYLLTGEYDPLALNGGTEELAACIPAATYMIIPGAGHFGPSENPDDFKEALGPVLQEIVAKHR